MNYDLRGVIPFGIFGAISVFRFISTYMFLEKLLSYSCKIGENF